MGIIRGMPLPAHLDRLNADELRCFLIESQAKIDKLTYTIEREGTELDHDDRRRLRQEQAKPILDEFAT